MRTAMDNDCSRGFCAVRTGFRFSCCDVVRKDPAYFSWYLYAQPCGRGDICISFRFWLPNDRVFILAATLGDGLALPHLSFIA